jgi:uncharacterized membrane protein YphA (DoxX/SURF4 family)
VKLLPLSHRAQALLGFAIGSVWVFHGLYSKILGGIPRHRLIVGRILGETLATPATFAVGALEILLGVWVFIGWKRRICALVQTLAITAMNALEIVRAPDLLISAPGMVTLNACFLAAAWIWAAHGRANSRPPAGLP